MEPCSGGYRQAVGVILLLRKKFIVLREHETFFSCFTFVFGFSSLLFSFWSECAVLGHRWWRWRWSWTVSDSAVCLWNSLYSVHVGLSYERRELSFLWPYNLSYCCPARKKSIWENVCVLSLHNHAISSNYRSLVIPSWNPLTLFLNYVVPLWGENQCWSLYSL